MLLGNILSSGRRHNAIKLLALSLAVLMVAGGCGWWLASRLRESTAPPQPSAFQRAYETALASPWPLPAQLRTVLAAHPEAWSQALSHTLFGDPVDSADQRYQALNMLADLPPQLAIPLAERALTAFGETIPGMELPGAFLLDQVRHGSAWAQAAALGQITFQSQDVSIVLPALEAIPSATLDRTTESLYQCTLSPPTIRAALADRRIPDSLKAAMIQREFFQAGDQSMLEQAVRQTNDPQLQEAALVQLAWLGAPGAAAQLGRLSDSVHAIPGIVWPAQVMTAVKGADPRGYIARGMDAVSSLLGEAYVDIDRWKPSDPYYAWLTTPDQYDPAQLPAWRSLLRTWGGHPGADDIAYIIGREEELLHHYRRAAESFWQAASLPDGDMGVTSCQRLLFVLDVEATRGDLAQMLNDGLPPGMVPLVRYALAVHDLRRGSYPEALGLLQQTAADAGTIASQAPTSFLSWQSPQAPSFFTYFLPWQTARAKELASLAQAATTPEGKLAQARYVFDHSLLYYFGAWQGGRATYLAFGLGQSVISPAWIRYQGQMNNYAVAEGLFAAVAQDAQATAQERAQGIYGEAASLAELSNYGADTDIMPPLELRQLTDQVVQQVLEVAPQAKVAPQALMSLFYLTGDQSILPSVLQRYPGTPAAYDAKLRLEPRHHYTVSPNYPVFHDGTANVDFQTLCTWQDLAPQEQALARPGGKPFTAMVVGQRTLLRVAPTGLPPGAEPQIVGVAETGPGKIEVHWGYYFPAQVPGLKQVYFPGVALARVFWPFRQVNFTEEQWAEGRFAE